MNGWWIGFLVQAVILRVTTKAQAFAWTFVWIMAPLSAIYFPLATLPPSLQLVAKAMPTSYVFEEMRSIMQGSPPNWGNLGFAAILSAVYVAISIWLMRKAFTRVLSSGLVKVY
jgi:ABC-2 type transport system permease protein